LEPNADAQRLMARALAVAALGIIALIGLRALTASAPRPEPLDAPAQEFSGTRAKAVLRELIDDGVAHPIGSTANAIMRERIVRHLQDLGFAPELRTGLVCDPDGVCGQPTNIVVRIPGRAGDHDAVLLCAHYDSWAVSPGASDDGASVAAIIEIARILKARPAAQHPVVLLIDEGEEVGFLGAQLFVREDPWARQVRAAVNLDARGNSGQSFMFETGSANAWLVDIYQRAVAHPATNSVQYLVYKLLPNDTDFTVFKAAGYQGFNFAYIDGVAHHHSAIDSWENADPGSIQHQGENALATVLALANAPLQQPPAGEAVFFDVFGFFVAAWPAAWMLPLASLTLLLALFNAIRFMRVGALPIRQLGWAIGGWLAAVFLSAIAGLTLLWLLRYLNTIPIGAGSSWIAYPLPLECTFLLLALIVLGGVSQLLTRRAGFHAGIIANGLLNAALAVLLALKAPLAGFLFLLPAAAAAVTTLLVRADGGTDTMRARLAVWLPVWVSTAVLLLVFWPLYSALGDHALPVLCALTGLATAGLLPLLGGAAADIRRGLMLGSLAGVIGGLGATMILPAYSSSWPQMVNLDYWLDADTNRSYWLARVGYGRLPAAIRAAAPFSARAQPFFWGVSGTAFSAAAPPLALSAPTLTVASAEPVGADMLYRIRLRSPRGAPELRLDFPARTVIDQVAVIDTNGPAPVRLGMLSDGRRSVDMFGVPAAGIELQFLVPAESRPVVQLYDQSSDLPAAAAPLLAARSPIVSPWREGDITVVKKSWPIAPSAVLIK
jgi:Peptidase family M28